MYLINEYDRTYTNTSRITLGIYDNFDLAVKDIENYYKKLLLVPIDKESTPEVYYSPLIKQVYYVYTNSKEVIGIVTITKVPINKLKEIR